MPDLQKYVKLEDVSCMLVHDVGGYMGETIENNSHFAGKIWSFARVFEKWLNATARLPSATIKI